MLLWIVVAAVAVALLGLALRSRGRGRGVDSGELRSSRQRSQGKAERYSNPSGPNFGGPF